MKQPFVKNKQIRTPIRIKPTKKIYDREPLSGQIAQLLTGMVSQVGQFVNAIVLLAVIVFLSVLIGTYTFPVLQLNTVTLQAILDIIT